MPSPDPANFPPLGTDWLTWQALRHPQATALVDLESGSSFTYRQLAALTHSLAAILQGQDFSDSDTIALLADNHPASYILFGACQQIGISLVPLNTRLAPAELRAQLLTTRPRHIYATTQWLELAATFADIAPASPAEHLLELPQPDHLHLRDPWPADHPLMLLFTSGSTGTPKAVTYTHGMLCYNALNTQERFRLSASDVSLHLMPPFHTGGWHVLPTPTFFAGGTLKLLPRFEPSQVLQALAHPQLRMAMLVPTMCRILSEHPGFEQADFSHLRFLIVGGEALPVPLIERWHQKGVAIRQGYGLTEAGPGITSLEAEDTLRKRGSIGTPNTHLQTRIVNDHGQPCPPNTPGEFQLRGPVVTPGYWHNPQATTDAFTEDGWLRTGDIVQQDTEGYLYVVDRLKHMYISGGENVYPAEVEAALRAYPSLADIAIVPVPDPKWGEIGVAVIVLKQGQHFHWDEFLAWATGQLARYKLPKQHRIVDALPLNATGKIDRKALRQYLMAS